MTTKTPSYSNAPSYSCRIWHDRGAIYTELASGLIQKHDKTEGALSKVLKLLERESRNQSPRTNGKSKPTFPTAPRRTTSVAPSADVDKATEMLKRKGLI